MRQRLTIALATICEPEFIIADEPTTALDVLVQQDVLALIKEVQGALGSSIIFVTHDMSVHAAIADRHRHHLCGPAGRGRADRAYFRAGRSIPTPRT